MAEGSCWRSRWWLEAAALNALFGCSCCVCVVAAVAVGVVAVVVVVVVGSVCFVFVSDDGELVLVVTLLGSRSRALGRAAKRWSTLGAGKQS